MSERQVMKWVSELGDYELLALISRLRNADYRRGLVIHERRTLSDALAESHRRGIEEW